MTKVPALLAAAGAVAILLAASAQAAGPFITSGMTFVEGKDAEPPPWPSSLPQKVPDSPKPAVSNVSYTPPPAPQPKPAATASSSPASSVTTPPPETLRVAEATPSLDSAIVPVSAKRPLDTSRVRARRQLVPQNVSFGRTSGGVMVTIVWDR